MTQEEEGLPFPTLGIVEKKWEVRIEQEVRCVHTSLTSSLYDNIWRILGKAPGSHIMWALEGLECLWGWWEWPVGA